ncbi:MAG TPA: sulfurtransferase TusA family protein [Actinomycetota bacterium]|jgi:TusA-related sulfurtransferase|nr:sulfurtransferase TusA family protein [Actinomycetota bacterium]
MTIALSESDLANLTADKVVDARGSACPGPLLEAKKGIGGVAMNAVLEIWSSDPNTKTDIEAWAGKVGHEFLGSLAADGYDRVFLRRMK